MIANEKSTKKIYSIGDTLEFEVEGEQFTGQVERVSLERRSTTKDITAPAMSPLADPFAFLYGPRPQTTSATTTSYHRRYEIALTDLPYGYEGKASLIQENAEAKPYVTTLEAGPEKDDEDEDY